MSILSEAYWGSQVDVYTHPCSTEGIRGSSGELVEEGCALSSVEAFPLNRYRRNFFRPSVFCDSPGCRSVLIEGVASLQSTPADSDRRGGVMGVVITPPKSDLTCRFQRHLLGKDELRLRGR